MSCFRGTYIMLAPKLDRPGNPPGYWGIANGISELLLTPTLSTSPQVLHCVCSGWEDLGIIHINLILARGVLVVAVVLSYGYLALKYVKDPELTELIHI